MKIVLEETDSSGRYVTEVEGHTVELTFSKLGASSIIIDHTGVPDALRGKKVGEALVLHAVEKAREMGKTIIPLCPFAASQFRKHPEWRDVLKD
ncbi:MAG: GNAT family N-acetyltransferase [Ahrensia sp.]|nr:GNAT family N-acetyltransferase [Ahrensia sp.]